MNRRMLGTLGLSLWALAALACAGAPPGGAGTGQPQGDGPSPGAADTACQSDADCVVVETACCDHCNGGADVRRPGGAARAPAHQT